jgi:hypothetical protein
VDSPEFRKLLAMVARAGGTFLTPEWDVKLCHRTKMVSKAEGRQGGPPTVLGPP